MLAKADPEAIDIKDLKVPSLNDLMITIMHGVNAQAFSLFGNKVLTGPFNGMEIPEINPSWDDGNASTKLLGTYEHELHSAVEFAIWRRPRVVINVGCSEGYYAIGLARRLPKATIYGFDGVADSVNLCSKYAIINEVQDRIKLDSACCEPAAMHLKNSSEHKLYVIDVEGEELSLVNLKECPSLQRSDVIVECHDFVNNEISSIVADRFGATHRVELICPRLPNFEQFVFFKQFPTLMNVLMAVEKRPMPCCWLACWANVKGD